MSKNIDVVMIGGGYAGVMAANRLTQHDDVTVTVINPRARSSSRGFACISFGRRTGIFQLGHKDDTAIRTYLSGLVGKTLKEFSCAPPASNTWSPKRASPARTPGPRTASTGRSCCRPSAATRPHRSPETPTPPLIVSQRRTGADPTATNRRGLHEHNR